MHKPNKRGPGQKRAPVPRFLIVARVLKAWGLQGELKVQVLISPPQRLFQLQTVYLGESLTPYHVERCWWHCQDVLLKLRGCNDRTCAEALQGQTVLVDSQDLPPLGPNEYYAHQLVGLQVVTIEGQELGRLTEVLETGANDVYVVRGAGGEVLLPARIEVIRQVDLEKGVMTVCLLPGLLP